MVAGMQDKVLAPEARDRYVSEFRRFAGNGAGDAPAWLREIREAAIARFAELGFPTMRQEEWRFTSVAPIVETPFALAYPQQSAGVSPRDIEPFLAGGAGRHCIVFLNGAFAEELSSLGRLPAGVKVGSLAAALETEPELARQHLARYARYDSNAFTALSTAFAHEGAFVYVPPDALVDKPLQLLFVCTADHGQRVSHPRNLVVVDRGARATVVETYAALTDATYWTNAVTEVVVGDGARADYYRIQRESQQAYHVATTQCHQGRDSVVALHAIALGAALARHDINAVLDGTGGELLLNGLYVLGRQQHVDHHTVIDHAKPHCESHEFFNGILDDHAHGVFNGRIIVRKGAQRTDSKQTNNNLVLSEHARADSQPQLEIYADDVKCTHGATLGPLDEMALFYLKTRGVGPEEARSLLTYGFGAEILARMQIAELRDQLERLVRAWLHEGVRRRQAA